MFAILANAVLRPPSSASLDLLSDLVKTLLTAIEHEPITGNLWIIEPGRIRVHGEISGQAPE